MRTAGVLNMLVDQFVKQEDYVISENWIEVHASKVAAKSGEITVFIKDVSNAAAHASAKIASSSAQDHDSTVCHVLAAVVSNSLHHGGSTGVSNRETFACDSVEVSFPARRAVKHCVADEYVVLRRKGGPPRGKNNDLTA